MSNLIPPLLSSSPPPIEPADDDDEFGDFTMAADHSYGCDLSIPNSPQDTPKKNPLLPIDLNSNNNLDRIKQKDFQDKRKSVNEVDIKETQNMPNASDVPNDMRDSYSDIHNIVPEDIGSKIINVPSSENFSLYEMDDIYREEPPEILPDDGDEEFGEFEFNPIPVLENELNEDFNVSIPFVDIDEVEANADTSTVVETLKIDDDNTSLQYAEESAVEADNCDNSNDVQSNSSYGLDGSGEDTNMGEFNINDTGDSLEPVEKSEISHGTSLECVDTYNNTKAELVDDDDDDEFGDFADFSSAPHNNVAIKEVTLMEKSHPDNLEDDFGDFEAADSNFADFTSTSVKTDDDDFDEFAMAEVKTLEINSEDVLERAECIILEMFMQTDVLTEDFNLCDFLSEDSIFKELKDITDTNALSYQWSKSKTQQGLLKALNIDTRNILFGPGRSNSMPKFAANLGLIPLEPLKSNNSNAALQIAPSKSTNPPAPTTSLNCTSEIPDAQFDWNESGLANPLDSAQASTILLDLEQLVASLDMSTTSSPTIVTSKVDIMLDDWDLWLQSVSNENGDKSDNDVVHCNEDPPQHFKQKTFDNESVNSLQFADVSVEEEPAKVVDDGCDDFTSFQSSQNTNKFAGWSTKVVPLRESYINNIDVAKKGETDEPGWLKPTILTPVLYRKDSDQNKSENDDAWENVKNEDTDWLPSNKVNFIESNNVGNDLEISAYTNNSSTVFDENQIEKTNSVCLNPTVETSVEIDDDFGDFQMSLPPAASVSSLTVLPVKYEETKPNNTKFVDEILQPVQMFQSKEVSNSKANDIIWPDPGITDEELLRFELYSKTSDEPKNSEHKGLMYVEKSVVIPANKVILPSKEVLLPPNNKVVISKDLVLPILESSPRKYAPIKSSRPDDDDDFTDFMSNQDFLKSIQKSSMIERTATPELPLSIPQLSHIQPPKLPIPVITPQGLMQTKIPTTMPTQTKFQIPLHVNPPEDGYQPSIISQQFALQVNQNTYSGLLQNTNYQTTNIPANIRTPTHQVTTINASQINGIGNMNSSFDDNDEWSEFISSRPTVPPTNGSASWNRGPNIWNTETSPNIITNPVHFQMNVSAASKRNNIPCISALPDLDFASPKSRTFHKK